MRRQSERVQVVWFKRDLRVEDHKPLVDAAKAGPVLPLYVVEPDWWAGPDMSARQWDFVRESLVELRAALADLGQPLVVRVGEVVEVLAALHDRHSLAALWSHEETGNGWTFARDRRVATWCAGKGIPWQEIRQTGVIRRLGTRDGWAARWDRFMAMPAISPPAGLVPLQEIDLGGIPTGDELGLRPDVCPGRQRGGRRAGMERLMSFLTERGRNYRSEMSSPLTASHACSRLSPHLAWGTVSIREAAQATWNRQREVKMDPPSQPGWRGALSSFSGRLHWHCHFMQKLEDAPSLEVKALHPAYEGLRPTDPDQVLLEAWEKGETGFPCVDACMRSLKATGWINFRMRAMLMAVASYHLWLDWRRPGEHLARLFTDYEPGIHWPQVQMQSGTTGVNLPRIYNPVKQGRDQDPDGCFVRRWVPELASVPDRHLHEPWTWEEAGKILGSAYPEPIVDHLQAARSARQAVWRVRSGDGFRETAGAIQQKHGSRKSGMPLTGRRRRGRQPADGQLAFGLERQE